MQKIDTIEALGIKKEDKVLAVFPHPDDESVYAGGLLHLLVKAGVSVNLIILTKGEKSTLRFGLSDKDQLGEVRSKELFKATEIVGISTCQVGDFKDGLLVEERDLLISYLSEQVKVYNPSVFLALEPSGIYGHPDHIAVTSIVELIARSNGIKTLYATVIGEVYKPSANARKMALPDHSFDPIPPEFQLTFSADVAKVKLQAIRAHASQHMVDTDFMQKWGERMLLTSEFYTFLH